MKRYFYILLVSLSLIGAAHGQTFINALSGKGGGSGQTAEQVQDAIAAAQAAKGAIGSLTGAYLEGELQTYDTRGVLVGATFARTGTGTYTIAFAAPLTNAFYGVNLDFNSDEPLFSKLNTKADSDFGFQFATPVGVLTDPTKFTVTILY